MRRFLLPLLLSLALPAQALAEAPATRPTPPEWDRLTPAQRDSLVAPLRERWNANPDDRARMLERAARWQAMTPEERTRAQQGVKRWQRMSPEKREQMRALYGVLRTLPEAERKTLRERWKTMTPEQRQAWVEAHAARPGAGDTAPRGD